MRLFDSVYVDLEPVVQEFGIGHKFQTKGLSCCKDTYRITTWLNLLCSVTGALCWSLTRCARASGSSGNTRN